MFGVLFLSLGNIRQVFLYMLLCVPFFLFFFSSLLRCSWSAPGSPSAQVFLICTSDPKAKGLSDAAELSHAFLDFTLYFVHLSFCSF